MKPAYIISLSLMLVVITSCSWQEYFAVFNHADKALQVHYLVADNSAGLPVFDRSPRFYSLTRDGDINWNQTIPVSFRVSGNGVIEADIPANTVMIFGTLSNDHYTHCNQKFINDRTFNLLSMSITMPDKRLQEINKKNFDRIFKKKSGIIAWHYKE